MNTLTCHFKALTQPKSYLSYRHISTENGKSLQSHRNLAILGMDTLKKYQAWLFYSVEQSKPCVKNNDS